MEKKDASTPQTVSKEMRQARSRLPNSLITALLTDLYQITMCYAYWKAGLHEQRAVFDVFFRKSPFGGEFAIFAGLHDVTAFVREWNITEGDVEYLKQCNCIPGADSEFWEYLLSLNSSELQVWAVHEGSAVFPREPVMRVEGPLALCQLLETSILNLTNYASLVCTNAARFRLAAGQDKKLLEFGLRRAQGPDGGVSASRYSYIGGFDDYLELFVQYGRVALFMPVFPIGAILALLNNFIEQRGDSYKMLYEQNPMFPAVDGRDTTADVWFVAFSVLSYLAIASNVALLGMDRDSTLDGYQSPLHPFFPERFHDLVGTLAILFVLEHALILMKTIIAYYWATTDRPTSQLATEENAPHQPLFTHISETNASTPAALSASVVKFASDRSNEEQARLKAPGEAAVVAEVLRVLSTRGVSQHYTSPASLKGDILACIRPLTSRIRQAERERDEAFAFASEHISPEVLCKLSRKND